MLKHCVFIVVSLRVSIVYSSPFKDLRLDQLLSIIHIDGSFCDDVISLGKYSRKEKQSFVDLIIGKCAFNLPQDEYIMNSIPSLKNVVFCDDADKPNEHYLILQDIGDAMYRWLYLADNRGCTVCRVLKTQTDQQLFELSITFKLLSIQKKMQCQLHTFEEHHGNKMNEWKPGQRSQSVKEGQESPGYMIRDEFYARNEMDSDQIIEFVHLDLRQFTEHRYVMKIDQLNKKLKAESERSAENEKGLYLELGWQLELRLSAEDEIQKLQKQLVSEQETNARVDILEEERTRREMLQRESDTAREDMESYGQRNNTLPSLDCVCHEKKGNTCNDWKLLMVSGCLGGTSFVAICIIIFLCFALRDKKMKKITDNSESDDVMIILQQAKMLID